jgi:phage protein U
MSTLGWIMIFAKGETKHKDM